MELTAQQEAQDLVDSTLAIAERIEEEIAPQLERAAALRDKAGELAKLLGLYADQSPSSEPNSKPPVNGKPKRGRKVKASEPKTAKPKQERKPRLLFEDADNAVIEELGQHESLALQEIIHCTGLSRPQASAAVKRLVASGRILQTGNRRGAKYSLAVPPPATEESIISPAAAEAEEDVADHGVISRKLRRLMLELESEKREHKTFDWIRSEYEVLHGPEPELRDVLDELIAAGHVEAQQDRRVPHQPSLYRLTVGGQAVAQANP